MASSAIPLPSRITVKPRAEPAAPPPLTTPSRHDTPLLDAHGARCLHPPSSAARLVLPTRHFPTPLTQRLPSAPRPAGSLRGGCKTINTPILWQPRPPTLPAADWALASRAAAEPCPRWLFLLADSLAPSRPRSNVNLASSPPGTTGLCTASRSAHSP